MSLLNLTGATLRVGRKALFEDLNLAVGAGERVGLIGPNGSGKTSVLRLFAQELELDKGELHLQQGAKVGYLPQNIELEGNQTLLEFVRLAVPGRESLEAHLARVEAAMAEAATRKDTPQDEARLLELSAELADLHERLAHFETLFADHVALRILAGLGFREQDRDRDLSELSGGWKMRAVLAALLFMQPDLLLLDEPTNHLDLPSVAWFSGFLKRWQRSFILISHDREFLNEQIDRVISFEPEGVRQYNGNLDSYERQREEERVVLANRAKNLAREREKAEQFITRFRAQAHKAKAVQSRVKALAKMDEVETLSEHQAIHFSFPPAKRCSKLVLKTQGLTKRYGDHTVFDGVDLDVLRGEKIGVIGVNGAGKTTLLKTLAGELQADGGEIALGHHVEVGYYAQHHAETLHPESTIFDEVFRVAQHLTQAQVRSMLGSLLFTGEDVDKPIGVLSGGERSRVALARLLLNPKNLLLMDEPTNHLDLRSSEQLAEALSGFDGTLIFVSHNRSFVRRLATRIWNVAEGRVETYPGTLDEYMESAVRRLEMPDDSPVPTGLLNPEGRKSESKKKGRAAEKERRRREAEARARRKERVGPLEKEIARLEARIGELEVLQKERSALLSDPDVYAHAERSAELMRDFQAGQGELDELTAAWEAASLRLEEALEELEAAE